MKNIFAVLLIVGMVILSGCNFYRSCPTYTKEKNEKDASSISVDIKNVSDNI
jgi:hypothetical protein